MPLTCTDLNAEQNVKLNREVLKLHPAHPMRKSCSTAVVEVKRFGETLVYFSPSGFYFWRMASSDIFKEIMDEMYTPRKYLCFPYEIVDGDGAVAGLKRRFQDLHGTRLEAKIDYCECTHITTPLVIVKFPAEVVREMMQPNGGTLKTIFRGEAAELRKIPSLAKYIQLPETGPVHSVFATQYKKDQFHLSRALHFKILQDVVRGEAKGVCLQSIATWDA